MIVVAVRNIKTKGLLGLFWGKNIPALWQTVDAIADPSDYEYTRLTARYGGLYFPDIEPDLSGYGVYDSDSGEMDTPIDWSQAEIMEGLDEGLIAGKWRRFDFVDGPTGYIGQINAAAMLKARG